MTEYKFTEGDILVYSGDDERFDGQTLVLRNIEPWEYYGQEEEVWNTMDAMQGVFTEGYLEQSYKKVGNIHELDGVDLDD